MNPTSRARGQGKLIVFGEHAVVYGCPAVACSLPLGALASIRQSRSPRFLLDDGEQTIEADDTVRRAGQLLLSEFGLSPQELCVEVSLSLPAGAGLGSSAAMAVALARAAALYCDLDEETATKKLACAVAAAEAVFHGKASGIDQQAAQGSGFFRFQRDEQGPRVSALTVPAQRWVVARVAPSSSTATMVQSVAALKERHPDIIAGLLSQFSAITEAGIEALQRGDWEDVGRLLDFNQGLLNALGVSTPAIEAACTAARKAGALGAKLTGAGGGGCIVALGGDESASVKEALLPFGDVFEFTLPITSENQ